MIFDDGSFFSGFKGQVDIGLEKRAWVKLHVKNVDPHVWDYIRITYRNQLLGEFYHDQDFKLILEGTGNWRNRLDYTVKVGDDEYVGKTDWIWLGEMDTTYFKLEY
jgi:hypothetical protein